MTTIWRALVVLLPWVLRRSVLRALYGYELHARSRIGLAWVFPRKLVMGDGATIGHLTVAKGMDLLELGAGASIGRLNWLGAFPTGTASGHFAHLTTRRPALVLGEQAAITHRHLIDCTELVEIGRFTTVAGFRTQILTHAIDLQLCRQDAKPVRIGAYCFVGTACTILPGAVLPDCSVLGAQALLNKAHTEPYRLYAGVPATAVATIDASDRYFTRAEGYVI
jgi:acetyltransferase-like isoleucine patch superfamily enzyme